MHKLSEITYCLVGTIFGLKLCDLNKYIIFSMNMGSMIFSNALNLDIL